MDFKNRQRLLLDAFGLLRQMWVREEACFYGMLYLGEKAGFGIKECIDLARKFANGKDFRELGEIRFRVILDGLLKSTTDEDLKAIVDGFEIEPLRRPGRDLRNFDTPDWTLAKKLFLQKRSFPQIAEQVKKETGVRRTPDAYRKAFRPAKPTRKRPGKNRVM
jgi:hypothetical protein